jgi:MFS transporter, DHA1 family, multidrug resistance protein
VLNVWRRGRQQKTIYTPGVLLLTLTVGVSFLGIGFIMPLRAIYGQRIGATSVEIGLMASVALLTGFLAAPVMGWLGDRFGQRTVLWLGLLAHGALILAYIPIRSPALLIGLRGLEGIAIVGVLPPARALLNALAPKTRQGEAFGLLSSAQMAGILMGPAVGTILASQVGYTPSFLLASLPLFIAAATARLFLPLRGGQGTTVEGTTPVATRALFAPPLLLAYGIAAVLSVTNGVMSSIWSIFMLARGASLPVIGLSYTVYAVPIVIMTPLAGRVSDLRGRFRPILTGLLLYAAVYFVFGLPISPLWLVILSGAEGFPAAMARSALDGFLADALPAGSRGKVQANYSAAGTAGSFVGATASGFLYAMAPGAPFVAAGALFLATAAALLVPVVGRLFPVAGEVQVG